MQPKNKQPQKISMAKLKFFSTLKNKKHRQAQKMFIIEGKKAVHEAIQEGISLHAILLKKDLNPEPYLNLPCEIYEVEEKAMHQVSTQETPEGVLAVAPFLLHLFPKKLQNHRFFILDAIQDPGNLGTILRICDAFQIHGVILYHCVEIYNPKVVRASMGSFFRIPFWQWSETPCEQFLHSQPHTFMKTDLHGKPLQAEKLKKCQFIVLGSESHGIQAPWNSLITQTLTIPYPGPAESLNVATAAAIIAWEWEKNNHP